LADQAIPIILSGKARFDREQDQIREQTWLKSKPLLIKKKNSGPGYEMMFGEYGGDFIMFQVKKGEVYITSVGSWNI
jgi:hypothetical protein